MNIQPVLLFMHIVGVAVWVGGMFFAYFCLRPTAVELFEPKQRLPLWCGVLARFFFWVWWAVTLVAISGIVMFGHRGLSATPVNWLIMLVVGAVMMLIFVYVASRPYAALQQAVENEDWKAGGAALNRIRRMVGLNLFLGIATIAVATLGRLIS